MPMNLKLFAKLSFHAQLVLYFIILTLIITAYYYLSINVFLLEDFYEVSKKSQEEIFREGFEKRAQATLNYISLGLKFGMSEENYDAEMIADIIKWLEKDKSVLFLYLFDKNTKETILEKIYDPLLAKTKDRTALTYDNLNRIRNNKNPEQFIIASVDFNIGTGKSRLFIGFSYKELQQYGQEILDSIDRQRESDNWSVLVRTLIITAGGFFFAWVITIRITKPIKSLNYVTGRIADGDTEIQADENRGPIEFKNLARAFNKMIDKIVSSQEKLISEMTKYNESLDEQNKVLQNANENLQKEIAERMKAEAALRESRQRMDIALEASRAGLWDLDLRSGKFIVDDRMKAILDRIDDEEEITLEKWFDAMEIEDRTAIGAIFSNYLESGKDSFKIEHRMRLKTERWIWADIRAMVFQRDGKGYPTRVIGTINDITQAKKAEKAIKQSEQLLRTVIDTAPFMIIYIDDSMNVRQLNRFAETTLRKEKEDILGQNIERIEDDIILNKLYENIQDMIVSRESISFEIDYTHNKEEKYFLAYLNPNLSENGEILGSVFIALDQTYQKLSERAIKESEEKFRVLSESAPDGIVIIDRKGKITFWNNAAERIFGYTEAESIGKNIGNYIIDTEFIESLSSEYESFIAGNFKNVKTNTVELYARRKDMKMFPVDVSFSIVMMGSQWHLIAVLRDISGRKMMETALQKAKEEAESANRAKSEFLANMSHEIRTPMNAILGFSQILQDKITDLQFKSYVEAITTSGKSLLNLINDILDLSKIEAGRLELEYEAVNPNNIFKEIESIFAYKIEEKGLDFIASKDPDLPKGLILDQIRLRQVLLNLVGNALKFTEKGSITLSVRKVVSDVDSSKITLIFSVQDTGIGIPLSQQQKIFEAFRQQSGQSTRKYGGTGLGLAITRRLVEMMGGTISLLSEPGYGSTFEVRLDNVSIASAVSEDDATPESVAVDIRFNDVRLLLVDDIEVNRRLIKEYLATSTIDITEAENGVQAVDLALKEHPDIILMDMKMPEMDGYEATRLIKSDPGVTSIPVIALTASAMKGDEIGIKAAGCSGYLSKPVDRGALLNEIAKFLPGKVVVESEPEAAAVPGDGGADTVASVQVIEPLNLLTALKDNWEEKCSQLQKRLVIGEVKNFAAGLQGLAAAHKAAFLENYASKLIVLADSFDLMNIRKTLDSFKGLIAKFEEEYNNK